MCECDWRLMSSGVVHHAVWYKVTSISEVRATTIVKETTRHSMPEDSPLQACHYKDLTFTWEKQKTTRSSWKN
jgi:hypothetical protein